MIFEEDKNKPIRYDYSNIFNLLKAAFYGDVVNFERAITAEKTDAFLEAFYYCINEGCKREFKFAKFILDNFHFHDVRYAMSITATYIRNGKFDERLFLKKFDHRLYGNIKKSDVEPLQQFGELKDILYFISVLNSFKLDQNYENKDFLPVTILRMCYNLPDNLNSTRLTDYGAQIQNDRNEEYATSSIIYYPRYTSTALNPFSFTIPPGDFKNISNLEGELVFRYLRYKVKDPAPPVDISPANIMKDVRVAIEAFEQNQFMDECLTKFFLVNPFEALPLIAKYKPFLVFGNAPFDINFLDPLLDINLKYIHNFMFNQIMFHQRRFREFLPRTIDYCYIEACIISCNFNMLEILKNINKTCYRRLDYKNNKFLEKKEEIVVDYDEIFKRMKFDPTKYSNY